MPGSKVLVLGGTGPAGICLLRELVHRKHATIVYARNPSKIPADLASDALIEIIKGEINDHSLLSLAISKSSVVLSLLGPNINDRKISPSLFADYYKLSVFPLMRKHGVRRIIAMGTVSIQRPDDSWTFFQGMVVLFMRLFAGALYQNMINIAALFDTEARDLDWTVFRIAQIPGESDKESWKRDRNGALFTGWVGQKGWTSSVERAALAVWLVDAAEGKADEWIGKMPAIARQT